MNFTTKRAKTSAFSYRQKLLFADVAQKKMCTTKKIKIETKLTTEGALVYYGDIIKRA
ncbi:MAG: hypothetical protein L6V93_01255 [Clostridiales bacterium]|nr:MAG: hypothetical protein L6V93_01255 [Clostridiales bacterium]